MAAMVEALRAAVPKFAAATAATLSSDLGKPQRHLEASCSHARQMPRIQPLRATVPSLHVITENHGPLAA
jgi:hypothetical protein